MINVRTETLIRVSQIPNWCAEHIGHSVNRSTAFRWYTRGSRGVKLETVLIGGARMTSTEALERFIAGVTAAANTDPNSGILPEPASVQRAESYLISEGI